MKMMGLANWIHWTAWFTKNLLFLLISIIIVTALLKVSKLEAFKNITLDVAKVASINLTSRFRVAVHLLSNRLI